MPATCHHSVRAPVVFSGGVALPVGGKKLPDNRIMVDAQVSACSCERERQRKGEKKKKKNEGLWRC